MCSIRSRVDAAADRLLLPDGGPVLGEQHPRDEVLERLPEVARQYAQLQVDLARHVDELLALGAADMRPARMLERFDDAVATAAPASPEQAAGLARLVELASRFGDWCGRLAASPGGASLDHNDLHGGNVFLDASGGARFFDWGDAVVSHPFASALVLRSVVRWLQDVHVETPVERRILDAYLEPFGALGPAADAREVVDIALRGRQGRPIAGVEASRRADATGCRRSGRLPGCARRLAPRAPRRPVRRRCRSSCPIETDVGSSAWLSDRRRSRSS